MKTNHFLLFAALLLFFCFAGCKAPDKDITLRIAISKGLPADSYGNYSAWLLEADSTINWADMYFRPLDSALALLEECHGLLLTGGTDVNPAYYGEAFDTVRCWPVDPKRDSLEFALIEKARQLGMPILGICRGEQILNVSQGGSLHVDLPEDLGTLVTHQCEDKYGCTHAVRLRKGSRLGEIAGFTEGVVNSNHHQGIEILSDSLVASAFTMDGLIEAVEWKNEQESLFILGVQWHPERMEFSNPLSGKLAESFLHEAGQYALITQTK